MNLHDYEIVLDDSLVINGLYFLPKQSFAFKVLFKTIYIYFQVPLIVRQ